MNRVDCMQTYRRHLHRSGALVLSKVKDNANHQDSCTYSCLDFTSHGSIICKNKQIISTIVVIVAIFEIYRKVLKLRSRASTCDMEKK